MSILNSPILACPEPTRFCSAKTCQVSSVCLLPQHASTLPLHAARTGRAAKDGGAPSITRSGAELQMPMPRQKKSARKPLTEGKAPVRELAPQAARGGPSSKAATNTHTKKKASAGKGKVSAAKAAAPKAAKGKAAAQATAPKAIKCKAAAPAAVPVKKVIAKKRRSQGGITAADREDAMAALMSRNFHAQCAGLAELFS